MNWLLAAQIPATILALWLFTAYMTRSFPQLRGKRICLLIAHPDDEAMFFAPTLRALTQPALGNQVVILCLSAGNAEGLGPIRKAELEKSAILLGLRSAEHVVVVEDEKHFPDSMRVEWEERQVSNLLMKFFAPPMSTSSEEPAAAKIDVLLTFDRAGVSGHPNHRSLYAGAVAFVRTLMAGRQGWECPVKVYTLTSTNVLRKYSSILDCLMTIVTALFARKEQGEFPTPLLAVSSPGDFRRAQLAMTTAHKSQMRWFRWGWIGVSRYMVMNDLVKVKGF
ncbi:related to GPI12-N-acetylglucosaminyl phosphatidylinositol deacetylase [Lecanosticta acicola]|uniref:N-acetylglucosaminylphosphatidylinositol deacetylase n=1 Tax=Lecanosticta acicola TaxID=111012 RepID=A0AAI9EFD7_9PEZI|nr:related to GPI12-N-acetylglucosaminyl phosphatidylinositol deacetylase [Lecanosticta acicola]